MHADILHSSVLTIDQYHSLHASLLALLKPNLNVFKTNILLLRLKYSSFGPAVDSLWQRILHSLITAVKRHNTDSLSTHQIFDSSEIQEEVMEFLFLQGGHINLFYYFESKPSVISYFISGTQTNHL